MLHEAARRGLPVPAGFVLPDGQMPLPLGGEKRWAVRSAFSAEDQAGRSMAGAFRTELNVRGEEVPAAAARVRQSGEAEMRRDVLVMEMVAAERAGVAFLEQDYLDDLVNWVEGLGDGLVSGAQAGQSCVLARQGIGHEDELQEWQVRLRALLARVRRVFGDRDWDIEWADDGRVCWLLQVRPITAAPRRNDAFTLANHKEILPDLPSRLMATVIEESAGELFGYYRGFDPTLPRKRLFIEVFAGRPLIGISLMSDLMRHWGLPTKLVTGNIGGSTDRPAPLYWPRLLRKLPALLQMGWAQLRAVGEAERIVARTRSLLREEPQSFREAVGQLRAGYVSLVRGMFGLTAAMSGPLALLRASGRLAVWSARMQTPGSAMYAELDRLRGMRGAAFDAGWRAWLEQYGHRGVFESDVERPRFREAPEAILAMLQAGRDGGERASRTASRPDWLAWLVWPLWLQAKRPMRAREEFRSEMMHCFEQTRLRLLRLCQDAGVAPETLWMLTSAEARRLDAGWRPDEEFLAARRREIAELRVVRLPDLVRRFDDLERSEEPGSAQRRVRGISLTPGQVEGLAWTPAEPGEPLPEGFRPEETILVARSVDAGWVPTFLRVAGVAVETGGDLSHGSIILREVGLPAITNAGAALRSIRQGERVRLNAGSGFVERIAAHSPIESEGQPALS
jgi:pyruvate,water dikinase